MRGATTSLICGVIADLVFMAIILVYILWRIQGLSPQCSYIIIYIQFWSTAIKAFNYRVKIIVKVLSYYNSRKFLTLSESFSIPMPIKPLLAHWNCSSKFTFPRTISIHYYYNFHSSSSVMKSDGPPDINIFNLKAPS